MATRVDKKTQQSFVVKTTDNKPVGQLTIFYTGDMCTGGLLHLHQNTEQAELYKVFIKPDQTTRRM